MAGAHERPKGRRLSTKYSKRARRVMFSPETSSEIPAADDVEDGQSPNTRQG